MADRLKLMPIQKWPEIKSLLKLHLPRSIAGLNFLETREEIEKLGFGYKAKVYCPDGDASNGIIAFNIKDMFYEVNIQCPKDDTRGLEEALRTTKVIDWTRDIELIYTQKHVMQCVMKVIRDKNIATKQVLPSVTFFKYKDDPLFDVSLPKGYSFETLTLEHAKTVNENLYFKYPGSKKYIESLVKINFGYGLFKDGELLSSAFKRETGEMAILFTHEKHRCKGYGNLVVKLICNIFQERGNHIFFSCVKVNTKALNIYENIGMTHSFEDEWCYFSSKR